MHAVRSALENALLLAHVLNRTLIVPPLLLGHAGFLSWRTLAALQMNVRVVELVAGVGVGGGVGDDDDDDDDDDGIEGGWFEKWVAEDQKKANHGGGDNDTTQATWRPTVIPVPWHSIVNFTRLSQAVAGALGTRRHHHYDGNKGVRCLSVGEYLRRVRHPRTVRPGDVLFVPDQERYAYRMMDRVPYGNRNAVFDNRHSELEALEALEQETFRVTLAGRRVRVVRWFLMNVTFASATGSDGGGNQTTVEASDDRGGDGPADSRLPVSIHTGMYPPTKLVPDTCTTVLDNGTRYVVTEHARRCPPRGAPPLQPVSADADTVVVRSPTSDFIQACIV